MRGRVHRPHLKDLVSGVPRGQYTIVLSKLPPFYQQGTPVTIYDPNTKAPFPNNAIPAGRIAPQATALLNFLPLPNLPGQFQNYQRLASSESNNTRIGVRFIHSFSNSPGGAIGGTRPLAPAGGADRLTLTAGG